MKYSWNSGKHRMLRQRLPVAIDGFGHIFGVLQAVYIADLGAVVGRDRDLFDAEPFVAQFDDDLRVEVEIIGHVLGSNPAQGVQIISAVSAVELGQIQIERPVLHDGQDAVTDVLVKRHAAL